MATVDVNDPAVQSARDVIQNMLNQWGIGDLGADAWKLIQQGYTSQEAIVLQLQETDTYKERFKANELRRKAGLPVLSPAEYVSVEAAYTQVARQYGAPAGFYDNKDDFTNLIAGNVSAQELNDRFQQWSDVWNNGDQATRDAFANYYGIDNPADGIAFMADPDKALPLIEKKARAAKIGGAAGRNKIGLSSAQAEYLSSLGLSDEAAQQGFNELAQTKATQDAIGQRFGDALSVEEQVGATFGANADAEQRRQRQLTAERNMFDGGVGTTAAGTGQQTAGQV